MTEIDMTRDDASHATIDYPDDESTAVPDDITVETVLADCGCPLPESGEKKEHEPSDEPPCSRIRPSSDVEVQIPQHDNNSAQLSRCKPMAPHPTDTPKDRCKPMGPTPKTYTSTECIDPQMGHLKREYRYADSDVRGASLMAATSDWTKVILSHPSACNASMNDTYDVIWDSGALVCVTHDKDDFMGQIKPINNGKVNASVDPLESKELVESDGVCQTVLVIYDTLNLSVVILWRQLNAHLVLLCSAKNILTIRLF